MTFKVIRPVVYLTIPFPPSANFIWRSAGRAARGNKRVYLSAEYQQFLKEVAYIWSDYEERLIKRWNPLGKFAVAFSWTPPNNRKYDVDNRIKPTLDALTRAGVWEDDSQVLRVEATKRPPDKKRPRASVAIWEVEEVNARVKVFTSEEVKK